MEKEKALEIANKMYEGNVFNKTKAEHLAELENAKRRALIVVDELINYFRQLSIEESGRVHIDFGHVFWENVKEEIPNL
jgi:hypothetical protein